MKNAVDADGDDIIQPGAILFSKKGVGIREVVSD